MATCPAGHSSAATDYCDTCGLPIPAEPAPAVQAEVAGPAAANCPNCGTDNHPDALFCEACGYDFTTGGLPRTARAPLPEQGVAPVPEAVGRVTEASDAGSGSSASPADGAVAPQVEPNAARSQSSAPAGSVPEAATPQSSAGAPVLPPPAATPAEPLPADAPIPAPRRRLQPRPTALHWVAEIWIDPDWYATQGSSEAMPSPGLPDVIPMRATSALIGRMSQSRNIHPDLDCGLDSGVSRRHAQVSTDGTRWWIEDLESANGTFLGEAAGPLPTDPIGRGRVEFAPDQRIYVGAWTRIVVRTATEDEAQAFDS